MDAYTAIKDPFTRPIDLCIGTSIVLLALLGAYHVLPNYGLASFVLLLADTSILGYSVEHAAGHPEWSVDTLQTGALATGVVVIHFIPLLLVQQLLTSYPAGAAMSWILGALLLALILLVQYVLPHNIRTVRDGYIDILPAFTLYYLQAVLYAFGYTIFTGLALYLTILLTYQLILPWLFLAALLGYAIPVTTLLLVEQAHEQLL